MYTHVLKYRKHNGIIIPRLYLTLQVNIRQSENYKRHQDVMQLVYREKLVPIQAPKTMFQNNF